MRVALDVRQITSTSGPNKYNYYCKKEYLSQPMVIGGNVMNLIVYADFSCPDCYLTSRRADALATAGVPIDWRAVEHAPQLATTGARHSAADQQALTERFAALDALLLPGESLPWTEPAVVPKTEAAVSAYAEAYGAGVADDVRRLLFQLYWLGGADIGNPNVLRAPLAGPILRSHSSAGPLHESGYAVSVDRGPITTDAYRRIRSWRTEWQELGSPALPIVLTAGATLSGTDALRRLGKEIGYVDAQVDPQLDDPRRYPSISDRPSASWVSQIGGRWRNTYRLTGAH